MVDKCIQATQKRIFNFIFYVLIDWHDNLQHIWKCNWNHFMSLPLTSKLMLDLSNDEPVNLAGTSGSEILSIGISCLQLFVQQNFIGPSGVFDSTDLLSSSEIRSNLQINGIDLNVNVENPELLALSMKLIKNLLKSSPTSYVLQWWYLRILYIYAEVIDEPSESLYNDFSVCSEELLKRSDELASAETKALLLLEVCQQYLLYKRVQKAEQYLTMARSLLNTNFEVKGKPNTLRDLS